MKNLNLLVWLTQLGLSVALPLAGFICLGVWLREKQGWGLWVVFAGIALGLICAADGLRFSLKAMERLSREKPGKEKAPPPSPLTTTTELEVSMESRKYILKETAVVALGQLICVSVMFGIFALFRRFDSTVLWGGLLGGVVATANFLFMAIGASLAADRAEAQNVKGGKALLRNSVLLRFVVMFVILAAGAKSGLCNLIALVLPLVFTRPILTVGEFFRKSGEKT